MTIEELSEQGLLLPEEHWGKEPSAALRSQIRILISALLAVASAIMIWFGAGNIWTLIGTVVFFLDLGYFLWAVFAAVEIQMDHLRDVGAGGVVEGVPEEEQDTAVPLT